jgi:hypothetical protein
MADGHDELRLLILIARDQAALDEIVTGMLDAGVSGATVLESRGLSVLLREDMPFFAGIAALLPQHSGSRVILSLTTRSSIQRLCGYLDEMPADQRPIGITLEVDRVFGVDIRATG